MKRTEIITLNQAMALSGELNNLITEKGIDFTARINIRKTFNSITEDIALYQEERKALAKKLGKPSEENPDEYIIEDVKQRQKFNEETRKALEKDVEIDIHFTVGTLKKVDKYSKNYYGATMDLLSGEFKRINKEKKEKEKSPDNK